MPRILVDERCSDRSRPIRRSFTLEHPSASSIQVSSLYLPFVNCFSANNKMIGRAMSVTRVIAERGRNYFTPQAISASPNDRYALRRKV